MRTPMILLVSLTLALPACSGSRSAEQREAEAAQRAASELNTVCPITAEPADPGVVSTYRSRRVAFRDAAAQQRWNELDDSAREVALARVTRR